MSDSPLQHSTIGKISFWTGIGGCILFLITLAIAKTVPHTLGVTRLLGILVIPILMVNLVGIVLAIIAFRKPAKQRASALTSFILNIVPPLVIVVTTKALTY